MDELDKLNIRLQSLHLAVLAIAATMPDEQHKQMVAAFEIQKQYFLMQDKPTTAGMSRGTAIAMTAMQAELDQMHTELRTATETAHFFRQELEKRHA